MMIIIIIKSERHNNVSLATSRLFQGDDVVVCSSEFGVNQRKSGMRA